MLGTGLSLLSRVLHAPSDTAFECMLHAICWAHQDRHNGIKFSSVSLGQGQGPRAEEVVLTAREKGEWVLLENAHLARSWLPELEVVLFQLREGEVTESARAHSYNSSKR